MKSLVFVCMLLGILTSIVCGQKSVHHGACVNKVLDLLNSCPSKATVVEGTIEELCKPVLCYYGVIEQASFCRPARILIPKVAKIISKYKTRTGLTSCQGE
ncbi:Uncharacterised protein g7202 [Pycnogonum litorale]